MGKNLIYLLITLECLIYLVSSVDVSASILSNYTLSELSSYNQKIVQCQSDSDCPFGSDCTSEKVCVFGYYLCKNKEKCLYINTDVYDPISEELIVEYRDNVHLLKPILKSCNKEQVEDKICKTDTCQGPGDCLSGSCKDGICISDDVDIRLCKGLKKDDKMTFICGKQAQMSCDDDSECYNNHCVKDYCENQTTNIREFSLSIDDDFPEEWKSDFVISIRFNSDYNNYKEIY
ncbi:hypothetical protein PIROE2DRAFT_7035 [Piromyces sp. E2]|nr:hypothetical protein PIROE2DRAFT_7035 [Piromyces sp. E2]|eukprot:OUM65876.1 hypothetical protein PIROE2DRAFT_7035 [Piromyces sp. E2]